VEEAAETLPPAADTVRKQSQGLEMKKNSKGFSLLELLIVVAIILIIATIAIPSLLTSRQAANESAAVANLRTLTAAEVTYMSSGLYGDIPALIKAQLIEETFDTTKTPKSGYNYSIVLTGTPPGADYAVYAIRASSRSGRYSYYSTPDAVIRYSTATTEAPPGKNGRGVN
jgi:prepilin-type N-terminal cleavage/methylation domain-containing protein